MISIRIEGVVKRFGNANALDKVTLEIEPGELFFLLGPSGCGKTTLLRCLAGFYIPDSGKIFFDSEDVTALEPWKRNTGMMFQSYALWPHLSVFENVSFGLEQRRVNPVEIRQQVEAALDSVQMLSYATRKPNQLSGGQQQRVALARALVVRPRCLLLDEPLSNLDAKLRLEMRSEIRRVCKEFQLTTIYVTHDQKEALSVADRMAILDRGKIMQIGTPTELYRRPTNRFVADFIGETNFIKGKLLRQGGGFAQVQTALGEIHGVLLPEGAEPADGSDVTVSIRPECFHLESMEVDENCYAGRIADSVYYGELAQYRFESGGTSLKIFELNPRHLGRVGTNGVYAWVDPEDAVVLAS